MRGAALSATLIVMPTKKHRYTITSDEKVEFALRRLPARVDGLVVAEHSGQLVASETIKSASMTRTMRVPTVPCALKPSSIVFCEMDAFSALCIASNAACPARPTCTTIAANRIDVSQRKAVRMRGTIQEP